MAREPSQADDASPDMPVAGANAEKKPRSTRTKTLVAGAAIGIGSAALVAALLYANRSRGSTRT